jgi:hypothetical protein
VKIRPLFWQIPIVERAQGYWTATPDFHMALADFQLHQASRAPDWIAVHSPVYPRALQPHPTLTRRTLLRGIRVQIGLREVRSQSCRRCDFEAGLPESARRHLAFAAPPSSLEFWFVLIRPLFWQIPIGCSTEMVLSSVFVSELGNPPFPLSSARSSAWLKSQVRQPKAKPMDRPRTAPIEERS